MSYPAVLSDTGPSPYDSPMEGPGSVITTDGPPITTSNGSSFHSITAAVFEKQPPENMRKSNFFHFMIHLKDENQAPIEVERAVFKDFHDSYSSGQEYRNGLVYTLNCVFTDGTRKEQELCVRLIDSSTKQLILYEGTCKNPDFRRVLLTHELICSRCLEHRSCGNKNDTPSDPIIIDRYHLKFFVKCNQNCLKNAGNPKDSRRRFQVALYYYANGTLPIGCSESMFVHNNSKHGRRQPPFREPFVGDGKPYITSVYPTEGWTSGGNRVCIVGINFFEGLEVVFGTLQATAEVLSPNAIAVKTPVSPRTGEVDITLVFKTSQFCINNPGKFHYIDPDEVSFDHNFTRLERILRGPEDPEDIPKEMLLRRAADTLEAFYTIPRAQPHMAQPNHGFPTYYPRSPAIFTPLFTPQFRSPGFSLISPNKGVFSGEMEHKEDGSSGNYPSNPTSRCNSNEALSQQQVAGNMDGTFVFPQVPNHESANQIPPSSIQKPKPIPPMTAPMYPMAAMPYLHYAAHHMQQHAGFPKIEPGTVHPHYLNHTGEEAGNRNNNNSAHQGGGGGGMPPHMAGGHQHPVSFVPSMVPGSPSHGYVMAGPHSVSPGPIAAATPGGQAFTFGASIINSSPSKALRGGVGKPHPPALPGELSTQQNTAIYPSIFTALPSPQFGTFLFPPTTPTGLIAPISLPDLTGPTDSTPATTAGHIPIRSGSSRHLDRAEAPPTKKSKPDENPPQ